MPVCPDPYRDWLGLTTSDRPPTHYELLGLRLYESDSQRIENAEMMQMVKVLRHEGGEHSDLARQVARELEEAVRCLCDPVDKAAYDAELITTSHARQSANIDFQISPSVAASPAKALAADGFEDEEPPLSTPSTSKSSDSRLAAARHHDSESVLSEPPPSRTSPSTKTGKSRLAASPGAEPADSHVLSGAEARPAASSASKAGSSWLAGSPSAGPVARQQPAKVASAPRRKISLPELPELPAKQLLGVLALVLVVLSVWFLPGYFSSRTSRAGVLAQLEDPDPVKRVAGVNEIFELGLNPHETALLLIKLIKEDSDDRVRVAAASSLLRNGKPDEQIAAELKTMSESEKYSSVKPELDILLARAQNPQ